MLCDCVRCGWCGFPTCCLSCVVVICAPVSYALFVGQRCFLAIFPRCLTIVV